MATRFLELPITRRTCIVGWVEGTHTFLERVEHDPIHYTLMIDKVS